MLKVDAVRNVQRDDIACTWVLNERFVVDWMSVYTDEKFVHLIYI